MALDRRTPTADRKARRAWLETPAGITARLLALADLDQVDIGMPRWQLRYTLRDLLSPAPDAVVVKTYLMLRRTVDKLGTAKTEKDPLWKDVPAIPYEELGELGTEAAATEIRKQVRTWWKKRKG